MKYTQAKLESAVDNLCPEIYNAYLECDSYFLPRVVMDVAAHCWIHNVPDNDDTKILRAAIADLDKNGHFNYDGQN